LGRKEIKETRKKKGDKKAVQRSMSSEGGTWRASRKKDRDGYR